eukprot:Pgem_evm1s9677
MIGFHFPKRVLYNFIKSPSKSPSKSPQFSKYYSGSFTPSTSASILNFFENVNDSKTKARSSTSINNDSSNNNTTRTVNNTDKNTSDECRSKIYPNPNHGNNDSSNNNTNRTINNTDKNTSDECCSKIYPNPNHGNNRELNCSNVGNSQDSLNLLRQKDLIAIEIARKHPLYFSNFDISYITPVTESTDTPTTIYYKHRSLPGLRHFSPWMV